MAEGGIDSGKAVLLRRLLSTELSALKTDCAQLSNDIREIVGLMESDMKTLCAGLLRSCKEVNKERDDAVRLYKMEETRRRDLLNQLHVLKGNIRVVCRIRPVNKIDEEKGSKDIAVHRVSREMVRCGTRDFEFDEVFGPKQTNTNVFEEALPMIESVFEGFHACIFAYGQTGSGKTFTMSGSPSDRGVNYRAVERLFEMRDAMLATGMYASINFYLSNVEIYNETVRDLLGKSGDANELQIRQDLENGVYLPGCTRVKAETPKAVWESMELGQKNRAQALTRMNSESSRSHSVFIVELEAIETGSRIVRGKLILVDLAGSERLSKSGVSGERQREAQCINKSLSALGDVICALGAKAGHVPFRNSKLTYLLQDSMSKQNKVMMIVQTAPTSYNLQESLCTLSFGARARAVELGRAEARGASFDPAIPPLTAPQQQPQLPPPVVLPANRQPMSTHPSATSNKQHNDLLMQKMALEQKVLSMERALAEAEAKASLAEKAVAKKDEMIVKAEKERDDALQRLSVQMRARSSSLSNQQQPQQQHSQSESASKRQQEREMAIAQVKARLAEQERVAKEARERMVTPSRPTLKFGGLATANGVSSYIMGGGSGGKAAASLPLPPPMVSSSSSSLKSATKMESSLSFTTSAFLGLPTSATRLSSTSKTDAENQRPVSTVGIVPRRLQSSFGAGPTLFNASSGLRPQASLLGGSGPARVLGGSAGVSTTTTSSGPSFRRF